jgi:hypothetical protein
MPESTLTELQARIAELERRNAEMEGQLRAQASSGAAVAQADSSDSPANERISP